MTAIGSARRCRTASEPTEHDIRQPHRGNTQGGTVTTMAKTTKTMLRLSPIGIIASALLFAGCVAPAGAITANNLSDRARDPNVATHNSFSGVAKNNMSDAARDANLNSFAGVAKSNMSDAARDATLIVRRPFSGVAANNMSDAARQANVAAAQSFQGVAKNSMSDAARKAIYSRPLHRHH